MKKYIVSVFMLTNLTSSLLMGSVESTFLKSFIKNGDVVFDVGANVGKKTEVYLACGARVVCFEPQPECIAILNSKYKNNDNVIIEQIGLADKDGYLELFQCLQANTISTCSQSWTQEGRFVEQGYTWDKKIIIAVSTLDHMIAKYGKPNFCKIDVENFEFEVLKGLTQPISYISFEFASETIKNTQKCVDYLIALGYQHFNVSLGEGHSFALKQWVSAEVLMKKLETMIEGDALLWGDVYASCI
ncbi:MAG: FkbM family methyltransferase [Candidatus Dependentiae bacterium]|nr:FkbM family methyltransferase [Candidatus Dependentiae bacterium]